MSPGLDARWLPEFAATAAKTDKFAGHPDHVALLAAGLFGEAGSVVAELKKARREREAYPVYRERMIEELGDFLWYFVRLVAVVEPRLLHELSVTEDLISPRAEGSQLTRHLEFGAAVGAVLGAVSTSKHGGMQGLLRRTWALLTVIASDDNVSLREVAARNAAKTRSRWTAERRYAPLVDEDFPLEEQLPRRLQVDFLERARGTHRAVILRCNDINFGDRVTDNIADPDGYRFHDIFHFAYAVHLGWSPITRALMRTKRKSDSKVDEAQDGARAGIIEEAVSAIVFSRAKQLRFFEGLDHVDLDLLKMVKEFVEGYEVDAVPLWQWETAILDGYRIFRALCAGPGGRVSLDLTQRKLDYEPFAESGDQEASRSTSAAPGAA